MLAQDSSLDPGTLVAGRSGWPVAEQTDHRVEPILATLLFSKTVVDGAMASCSDELIRTRLLRAQRYILRASAAQERDDDCYVRPGPVAFADALFDAHEAPRPRTPPTTGAESEAARAPAHENARDDA